MHALSNDSKRKIHGTHQDRGGKARCQFFGAAFARPEFARVLDKFTRARSQDLWRANFLVPIQTRAKSYGLINFLVGSALDVIQTHPRKTWLDEAMMQTWARFSGPYNWCLPVHHSILGLFYGVQCILRNSLVHTVYSCPQELKSRKASLAVYRAQLPDAQLHPHNTPETHGEHWSDVIQPKPESNLVVTNSRS
jgi:hypothetical protein